MALREQTLCHCIRRVANLNARCQAAQIRRRHRIRRQPPVDRNALVELEIRLGEQDDGAAPRRNRRARDYRVACPIGETIEDSVEVVAGVRNWPQHEVELLADCSHELDVETTLDAALHDFEWWIGIGRLDHESAGIQGANHQFP